MAVSSNSSGCVDEFMAPAIVPAEKRYHAGITDLPKVKSSLAQPVEVCGLEASLVWLLEATCGDGSNPFQDARVAHSARLGNAGPGGRCGSIIDLYAVSCSEGNYEVYIDMYVCE